MADLFKLKGKVELDTSEFNSDVDEAVGKGKSMADSISGNGKSIRGALQNAFSFSAGQLISDVLKDAWNFIKETAAESIELASALEEVQNVVDVTFGDGASDVDRWAQAAKNAFGMSELKAKQYTGTMGAMLKSMGLADDRIVTMSENLVGLAGDMASFYNLDHETAFEKIRSGISGETEPLKQLGINMSVASLEAYALSQGITKSYDAMTQSEQAMLRYNYLLSVTKDAQGDFTRTSDSYANQIKLLNENIKSIEAELGQTLIDFITPGLIELNDWLQGDTFHQALFGIQQTENADIADANGRYSQADYLIGKLEEIRNVQGEAAENTDEWETTIKALTNVMPELGKYIDSNTGKIMVSTEELRKNAEAIRDLAIYDAKQRAVTSYSQAAEDAQAALADNQVKALMKDAELNNFKNIRENMLQEIMRDTGLSMNDVLYNMATYYNGGKNALINYGANKDSVEYFKNVEGSIITLENEYTNLTNKQQELQKNVDEANSQLEYATLVAEGYGGSTLEAALANREYSKALQDEKDILDQIETSYNDLISYQAELRGETKKTIDSIVKGFTDAPEAVEISTAQIMENMTKQQLYLDEYRQNLAAAREKGLNEYALLELSDGSKESAGTLRAIAGMTDAEIEAMNAQYEAVQKAKDDLVASLTEVKLASDPVYLEMQSAVTDLVASFNQQDTARANMLATGNGMIDAMDTTIGEMRQRVSTMQELYAQMLGMNIGIRMGGPREIITSGGYNATYNAKGLDYVPYNDYLTYLHKGEAVLTQAEADRYRAGEMHRNTGIDYDALAGVLANAMTGMAVQMDGRAVGVMIAPTVSQQIEQAARAGRLMG